jgi:hypothetical protein
MYTSSVLSWTIAPCGHAAWTSLTASNSFARSVPEPREDAELGRRQVDRLAIV